MKITGVAAAVEHLKPARAADAYAGRESLTFLRCRVTTDDGLDRRGRHRPLPRRRRRRAAEPRASPTSLTGQDALAHEALRALLAQRLNPRGATGVFVSALSAFDLALWDIKGKALGQPVARLIGGARDAVPAYATAGLPAFTEAELVAACEAALDAGFQRREDPRRQRAHHRRGRRAHPRRAPRHRRRGADARRQLRLHRRRGEAPRASRRRLRHRLLRGAGARQRHRLARRVAPRHADPARGGADDAVGRLVPRRAGARRARHPPAQRRLLRRAHARCCASSRWPRRMACR